jgi:hypothetical protein
VNSGKTIVEIHDYYDQQTRVLAASLAKRTPGDTSLGFPTLAALADHLAATLAADAATPLAILGGLILWLLRLTLGPLHPVRVPRLGADEVPGRPDCRARQPGSAPAPHSRKATKTVRLLDLVTERHGSLASIPLHRVAGISADLAPQLDLNTGAARTALRKAVLAARNGDPR